MTTFDLIVIAVFILSIGFAVVRGALRELGTLLALALAAGGAALLVKPLQALTGTANSFLWTAMIAAILVFVLFCILYFGLHVGLTRVRLTGGAARVDRIGGGVFGFARALVLVGLGFLAYGYYLDEDRRPDAVSNALTLPVAKAMANFFEGFAPASTRLDAAPSEEPAGTSKDEDENAAAEGYDRGERAALVEIVATATTTDEASADKIASPEASSDPIADILQVTDLQESDPE